MKTTLKDFFIILETDPQEPTFLQDVLALNAMHPDVTHAGERGNVLKLRTRMVENEDGYHSYEDYTETRQVPLKTVHLKDGRTLKVCNIRIIAPAMERPVLLNMDDLIVREDEINRVTLGVQPWNWGQ